MGFAFGSTHPTSEATARHADGLAVLVLAAVAVAAALTFRDYGLGWDDYTHAQYGDLLLALYASGFTDTRALHFVNLYEYGGGFDMAAALAAKVLPISVFETRRLLGAAVGIAGLAATWRIGRHLAGPVGGLIALTLLALCPLYYGHMFMNPKDAPFAAAMALLLLALVRAFKEYPSPSPATVLLFGIGLGLTIGSRVIGGLAALYALAAVIVIVAAESGAFGFKEAARRLGRFALALLPGLLLGYVVMGLAWPWGVIAPLNPLRATFYFSQFFEKPWQELFAGTLIAVVDMPRSYVPTLLSLKTPEIFLLLALAGVGVAGLALFTRTVAPPRKAALALVLAAATLPILFTVATRPAMYNGIRHFMFAMPPLAALGGLGGARFLDWLRRRGPAASSAGAFVLAALAVLPIVEMVRLHPYQYTYFNRIAGGIPGASGGYMLDYWGLSFKQAAAELRAVLDRRGESAPPGGAWKIAVCGPHPPAQVALGPRFVPTWDPAGADFAMMLGVFYCAALDAPVLAEVRREGVLYARVYDIRGRSIPSLFTRAPVQ
jgi:Dolichyl-phosphate-mannose-protein mannosyltransferase